MSTQHRCHNSNTKHTTITPNDRKRLRQHNVNSGGGSVTSNFPPPSSGGGSVIINPPTERTSCYNENGCYNERVDVAVDGLLYSFLRDKNPSPCSSLLYVMATRARGGRARKSTSVSPVTLPAECLPTLLSPGNPAAPEPRQNPKWNLNATA
eukprot:1191430-Prorocentrum_minimum.AAC.3